MPLWGAAPDSQINKVQIVMNAAARWATGLPKRTRILTLLERTGWFSVRELIRIATAIQVWKLIHYGKPQRLLERMNINEDLEIEVDPPRLPFSGSCFRWRGTREWNLLPKELRELKSLELKEKIEEICERPESCQPSSTRLRTRLGDESQFLIVPA